MFFSPFFHFFQIGYCLQIHLCIFFVIILAIFVMFVIFFHITPNFLSFF